MGSSDHEKGPPRKAALSFNSLIVSDETKSALPFTSISQEANSDKAEDHHRPGGGLRDPVEEPKDLAARKVGGVNVQIDITGI
jgi:hypothetical protein